MVKIVSKFVSNPRDLSFSILNLIKTTLPIYMEIMANVSVTIHESTQA